MRPATVADIPVLVDLMAEFYAEAGFTLDRGVAGDAFAALLGDERLGEVWLLGEGDGYVGVTLRFGMEFGGLMAIVDDLYVVPAARNRGLASAALRAVVEDCRERGIRAVTVEVDPDNGPAQTVYRRVGLVAAPGRQILALALAPPAHAPHEHDRCP